MLKRTDLRNTLTADDYEEALLLGNYYFMLEAGQARLLSPNREPRLKTESSTGLRPDEVTKMAEISKLLGYDPKHGRQPRKLGRTRADALPNPLPPIGTVLTSCLGDRYTIVGYAAKPRSSHVVSQILYNTTESPFSVIRSVANLLAGHLVSGVPLVTYDEDPRGLIPGKAVPLNKRRTLTKAELNQDEHADPATKPLTGDELRRRY